MTVQLSQTNQTVSKIKMSQQKIKKKSPKLASQQNLSEVSIHRTSEYAQESVEQPAQLQAKRKRSKKRRGSANASASTDTVSASGSAKRLKASRFFRYLLLNISLLILSTTTITVYY